MSIHTGASAATTVSTLKTTSNHVIITSTVGTKSTTGSNMVTESVTMKKDKYNMVPQ